MASSKYGNHNKKGSCSWNNLYFMIRKTEGYRTSSLVASLAVTWILVDRLTDKNLLVLKFTS